MVAERCAVLLMAYGGPGNLDEVEPYLLDVRGGRPTSPELVEEIRGRYARIGGGSPIRRLTEAQAAGLRRALGSELPVYVGMRHWHPYIAETVERIVADGRERRGSGRAPRARALAPRLPERRGDARALARPGRGRSTEGARGRRWPRGAHRADRLRVRPRGDPVRRGRRIPSAGRATGHAPRAHGLAERRPPPRRVPRGSRAPRRVRPRMAVTAVTTVAIVGAGIAGLAAAWELQRAGVAVTLLESERRAGGVIVTERRDGFVVEGGPDGFLAAELDLPALARELGIADRLVDQLARGAAVWTGSRFEPLAEGSAAALLGIEVREEDLGAGFRSFAGGMAGGGEALVPRLGPALRTAAGVSAVSPSAPGYPLTLPGGSAADADGVILAF